MLEKIINDANYRFNQILETLKSEFDISLDFTDTASLQELEVFASDTAKAVKESESFNESHKNPQAVCALLVLEAIKIYRENSMKMKHLKPVKVKKAAKKVVENTELDKAELLLASKNIVDDLQQMSEKVSKIQAEQLPAIVDRIKMEKGLGDAANYREVASMQLDSVIAALNAAKENLDNLTMGLSGDVPMAAEEPTDMPAPVDLGAEEPAPIDAAELPPVEAPQERERKEESRKPGGKTLNEEQEFRVVDATNNVERSTVVKAANKNAARQAILNKRPKTKIISVKLVENKEKECPVCHEIPCECEMEVKENEATLDRFLVQVRDGQNVIGTWDIEADNGGEAMEKGKAAALKHKIAKWDDNFEIEAVKAPKKIAEDVVDFPSHKVTPAVAQDKPADVIGVDGFEDAQQDRQVSLQHEIEAAVYNRLLLPIFRQGRHHVPDFVLIRKWIKNHYGTQPGVDDHMIDDIIISLEHDANTPEAAKAYFESAAKLGTGTRFHNLEKDLKKKGAKNPEALAAWIGKRKYGAAKMNKLAHHESVEDKAVTLIVETTKGKKGKKTFVNEKAAKSWLAKHGHHLKFAKKDK
jgi:hypothetical protein